MTDEEKRNYHEKVDDNIRKHGFHMTFVFADNTPSFCYSTGIYKSFGIPEIFISSLPQNLSYGLIENYVNKFKESKTVLINQKIEDLSDRFSVYLIDVPIDNLKDYVLSTIRFYGNKDYKYLQLVYPDTKGHFPNEIGYDYDQMIFGQLKK